MYQLFMATPEMVIFDDQVSLVKIPGKAGSFEMLTNHAPIIASMKAGKVIAVDKQGNRIEWEVTGGFVEMLHNYATILADTAVTSKE